jgi:hypothetical protein
LSLSATLAVVTGVPAGAPDVGVAAVVVDAGCKKFNTLVNAVSSRSKRGFGEAGTGSVLEAVVLGAVAPVAVSDAAGVLPGLAEFAPPKDWANFSRRCTKPL